MKDKQQSYFVNIGSSSLLVIFLILCLVTFAILSLSSAKSDYTFSERLAEHKRAYYEASARAEDIVGEIDSILYETSREVGSAASSSHVDGELDLYDNYIFAVSSALNGAFLTGAGSEDALTGEAAFHQAMLWQGMAAFPLSANSRRMNFSFPSRFPQTKDRNCKWFCG